MKQCTNCQISFENEFAFCPNCGGPITQVEEPACAPVAEQEITEIADIAQSESEAKSSSIDNFKFCSNCGKKISKQCNFCEFCGAEVGQVNKSKVDVMGKIKENDFVKSVNKDLKNSATIDTIKKKTQGIGEKINSSHKLKGVLKKKPLIIAVVAVVVLIVILSSLHKCDECEEIYFGKQNKVEIFGEEYKLCDECHDIWW